MKIAIVGCGQSAREWGKNHFDLAIGVNDCEKFGYLVNDLVIVNFKSKFNRQRLEIMLSTKANVWVHTQTWRKYFQNAIVMKLTPFNGYVRDGLIYSCRTSPMIAICLALKKGAKDIVLFGVDFVNHQAYRSGTRQGDFELKTYMKFFQRIKEKGVNVWLGAKGTAFDNQLPLYENKTREAVGVLAQTV